MFGQFEGPVLTPGALAWLERHITDVLERWQVQERMVPLMVEWYLRQPMRYLAWQNDRYYRTDEIGGSESGGTWVVRREAIEADVKPAWGVVSAQCWERLRLEKNAEVSPTLEAWLRADIEKRLMIGTTGGSARLTFTQQRKLRLARIARDHKRPKVCRDCGAEFVSKVWNQRRCPSCRESGQPEAKGGAA